MKIVDFPDYSLAVAAVYAEKQFNDDVLLLFHHEALGSIPQWKSFPQSLCDATGMSGIIYEREGYGNSSALKVTRAKDYLHQYAWKELPALIEKIISPDKKLILVGHSDGASIALLFASKFPKQVIGIISMAPHVIVENETLAGIAPAVKAFEQKKLEGLRKFHGDKTDTLFYAWANTWNLPEFKSWDITESLKTISCPVLAIQGKDDQYGTIRQLELIQEYVSGDVVIEFLPNCGHHPHLEKAESVLHLGAEFASNLLKFDKGFN